MATVFQRRGSPYWYAKFNHGGESVVFSTKTTVRREAVEILSRRVRELTGAQTADEAARAYLGVSGVEVRVEDNAQASLLRAAIERAAPEEVVSALMAKIKRMAGDAETHPPRHGETERRPETLGPDHRWSLGGRPPPGERMERMASGAPPPGDERVHP